MALAPAKKKLDAAPQHCFSKCRIIFEMPPFFEYIQVFDSVVVGGLGGGQPLYTTKTNQPTTHGRPQVQADD